MEDLSPYTADTPSTSADEGVSLSSQNGQTAAPSTDFPSVQLPLTPLPASSFPASSRPPARRRRPTRGNRLALIVLLVAVVSLICATVLTTLFGGQIGRASCRERVG